MIKKMKQYLYEHYQWLVLLVFLLITHLPFIVNNHSILIFYGDSYQEELFLYLGGWEKFHSLNFSLWDWTLGYGANYFSKIFNYASSPFFWVTLLFPKAWIPYLFLYLNATKITLLYLFTFKWLKKLKRSTFSSTIGALLMVGSGWVVFNYHYNFFLDAFLLYPLILGSIENYLSQKKVRVLIISLALLGIINFYFYYLFVPFMGLYVLFRLRVLYPEESIVKILKNLMRFIKWVILAFGISAIIFIPAFYVVLSEPRLQTITDESFGFIRIIDVFRYLSTVYSPVMERFDPTYFVSTNMDKGIGWSGGTSLYLGYLTPVLLPLIIFLKDKFHRNSIMGVYGILIILFSFPIFYRLLNGSMDVRWMYMFGLFNVYTVTLILDEVKTKMVIISFGLNMLILLSIFTLSLRWGWVKESPQDLTTVVLVGIGMMGIYSLFIHTKFRNSIFILLLIAEMSASFLLPIFKDPPMSHQQINIYLNDAFVHPAIEWINNNDKGFYRVLVDSLDYDSQNHPSALGYKGTSFYLSIYNYHLSDYYYNFSDTFSVPAIYGRHHSSLMTSVKYYVGTQAHPAPYGFDEIYHIDDYSIYQNRFFLGLGFSQSESLHPSVFKQESPLNKARLMLKYAIVSESRNFSYSYLDELILIAEDVYESNYFLERSKGIQNQLIYIEYEGDARINIESIQNGTHLYNSSYRQHHYVSQYIEYGIDALNLSVESKQPYHLYIQDQFDYLDKWYRDRIETAFTNIEVKADVITANILVENENDWIVSSIPYDEGWHLKVDGQSYPITKLNQGFIGFQLKTGEHQLEFRYIPPLFYLSIVISFISLSIYMYLIKNKII